MSVLAIVRPLQVINIGGTYPAAQRLMTPDPKEAAQTTGGVQTIDIDFGSIVQFDTIFLGYTNCPDGQVLNVSYGNAAPDENSGSGIVIRPSDLSHPVKHFCAVYPAPISARYVRLSRDWYNGTFIGVFAAGLAIRPRWGYELGAVRTIADTGTAERLMGGGFGIDPGTIVGGWKWTLGDLQSDEINAMWVMMREIGETRSLLVIEDPDQTGSLSDRCHWGLIQKLEQYERVDPANWKWSLEIGDWS